jgi:quercetin 2,3-dioxygenase
LPPTKSSGSIRPNITAHTARETHLGDLPISRALPVRDRRMVGPWCFLDRFGPLTFGDEKPMQVPPHPHIGLQTVTWLLEGEVRHTDSLNSEAVVSPGGVNVMTAGRGITHAEETPTQHSGKLNGLQLWVALPNEHRNANPSFTSLNQVPIIETNSGLIQLFAGTYSNITVSVPYYSKLIGLDAQVDCKATVTLPLTPEFEHAILLLKGDSSFEDQPLGLSKLYTLSPCRESLEITSKRGGRFLLICGLPFPEGILMWWNFVARTPEEIQQAHADWEDHRRFGAVQGTQLTPLAAPELGRMARPNPIS